MTDIFDEATRLEEMERACSIERQRSRSAPAGPSRRTCLDCTEEIEDERREAVPGCTRCIECERLADRWAKLFKR